MSDERNFYRSESRKDWFSLQGTLTDQQIQTGCLQRIADALEKIVPRYDAMQDSLALYKRWHEEEEARRKSCERRLSAMKGVVARLRKKKAKR